MQKFKDGFWFAWGLFLDGVDYVASWIAAYPKTTLALFVAYVAVRQ